MTKEIKLAAPLFALAMISQMFLFGVSYTGAAFNGTAERALPDITAYLVPHEVAQTFETVGENLHWATASALEATKESALAFLGVESGASVPQYYAATANSYSAASVSHTARVLGASKINSDYLDLDTENPAQ